MKNPMKICTLEKECRNYYLNQAMVRAYEKADALRTVHSQTPAAVRARKQYEEINGQIAHVDQVRSAIRKDYGIEAERMFTSCYIDGMDEKNVAARFSLSDQTFRQRMQTCLEREQEEMMV